MRKPSINQAAVAALLEEFRGNDWFVKQYWPENRARAFRMLRDTQEMCPGSARILDVGCGVGYISFLFAASGFTVTATDGWDLLQRDLMFTKYNIDFFRSDLNDPTSIKHIPDGSFDVVLLGEIFEHIFNHPIGVLRELSRILTAKGSLILTTPNPATAINALRLLLGSYSLWGTSAVMRMEKIKDGRCVFAGDIHYREYRRAELVDALEESGFTLIKASYRPMGASGVQPLWKRAFKRIAESTVMRTRLFGSTHYMIARRSD
jgi:2-polyprenyl-3-methyl-5-hydroxy-6-metoxy-1,4-benzoquinol methylase